LTSLTQKCSNRFSLFLIPFCNKIAKRVVI
jgi:hypothetical protein